MEALFCHREYKIRVIPSLVSGSITYNSYVSHPKFDGFIDEDGENYSIYGTCTYHEGDEIGFDTNHGWNMTMSDAELFKDALAQAIEFLDVYVDKLKEV